MSLQFARNTKVFVESNGSYFQIPILEDFSFSQATATSEITLSEMENSLGDSRRGRTLFTDSLEPVEWNFSTYMRPFKSLGGAGTGPTWGGAAGDHHCPEEVLWANFVSQATGFTRATSAWAPSAAESSADSLDIKFQYSNKSTLGEFTLYFILGGCGEGPSYARSEDVKIYEVVLSVVNSVSIDFDIDGIATINWSGFGKTIRDIASLDVTANAIVEDLDQSDNFIRNRLTALTIYPNDPSLYPIDGATAIDISSVTDAGPDAALTTATAHGLTTGDVVQITGNDDITDEAYKVTVVSPTEITLDGYTAAGSGSSNGTVTRISYDVTLTGGSISFENNITYLTPNTLCSVNEPLGHVTGTRTIGGNFTAYLGLSDGGATGELFKDLSETTSVVRNSFDLTFSVGGTITPRVEINLPNCHLNIPEHQIEDVISLDTTFTALPQSFDDADEASIKYVGS